MPLRLQATEDDVYHLMDLKEQYFIMTAICSVAEGISAYFFIYQKRCWDLAYLCTALALAIILLLRQAIKISRRIMEAENCYMALEEDSLAVCQPEKNGKYESCRIFYDEMDKIVEGSRRGVPEFYIVIRKEGKEQKSFSFWMKKNRNGMFSVYDPLALTIRDSWSFIGNSGGSYREEQGLSGPKHRKYGNCGGRISESVRQQACFWGMYFQNSWK